MPDDIFQTIQTQVKTDRIVLYMKGTPAMPQCGFSQMTVNALREVGEQFASYNVLDDPNLRQGIKDFSNWPTVPQLYVDGEFVGGSDIVLSMLETGDLDKLIKKEAVA
ncbi:MAG: monothiol glutaredoxin [Hyphomicrobiaceae bacterium]|jgi:monothiol glutaredoxin